MFQSASNGRPHHEPNLGRWGDGKIPSVAPKMEIGRPSCPSPHRTGDMCDRAGRPGRQRGTDDVSKAPKEGKENGTEVFMLLDLSLMGA